MNQVVRITGVFTASGESQKGPWTRWDIRDADKNKYSTFLEGLGKKAEALKGQYASVTYKIENRNGYDNNILEGIEPADGAVGAVNDVPESASQPQEDPRRSKDEVRYTAAVQAAATVLASDQDFSVQELKQMADAIAELIAEPK